MNTSATLFVNSKEHHKEDRKAGEVDNRLFSCLPGFLIALCCVIAIASPARAQRDLTKIPDPDPEIERRSFQVADGFEVNLFAADPLLAKPIQMNFDDAGRLWVACSEVYPQIKPGQKANDKIIILEDTHGVGKADKVTVFADGLLIPTGVEPGDGGAYVADSTELVFLKDTDGDGKADRRRIVLSGFGTEDTHHILHTLRWGPNGMLYFNQSVYIHSHIETPWGVRRLLGGGIWQFRPETMQLNVVARGFVNPWGHAFDRWGQAFATDGAYGEGINYLIRGASYVSAVGATRMLSGLNPGSPKHCGLEVLSGRHLPDDWQGNLLTNDFRGHRVCRFVLSEDGAGFASKEKTELIKTTHAAFRPVDIKMGPDGAIYIADWYNPIIQHGEVDFRDPRRDHTHGRIWRITAKNRPLVPRPKLVGASTTDLLNALRAPEDWTRQHAKRVLKERGKEVLPPLAAWIKQLDANDPNFEHDLLEALWTYQSLDVPERGLLKTLLHAKNYRARAAATRVLTAWAARNSDARLLFTERVADAHPRVRCEAVRGLAALPDADAVQVALTALDRPMDPWLDYALWLTVRELAPRWIPAFQAGKLDLGKSQRYLLFALQAAGDPTALRPLVEMLHAGKVPANQEDSVLLLIADIGRGSELAPVFDRALQKPEKAAKYLDALERAARRRSARPVGDPRRLATLVASNDESIKVKAIRLAGLWRVETLRSNLQQTALQPTDALGLRQSAIEALALLGGPASRKFLGQLASEQPQPAIRAAAIIGLLGLDAKAAARGAADLLASSPPADIVTEIIQTFLHRRGGSDALTAAVRGKKPPTDVARVAARVARSSGRNAAGLLAVFTEAGAATPGPKTLSPDAMRALVVEVRDKGDPVRGEAVFRRKDLTCLKCHAIAGAGGQVGPDLVSIGASAQVDYLIESILDPNKAVKEGYHSVVVTTKQAKIVTGIKLRETKTDLILRDVEDREIAVPLNMIDETAPGRSLMPDGLADLMTHAELVDIVRFLSELGKVGPYSVLKNEAARRWQVLEPSGAAYTLIARTSFDAVATSAGNLSWSPAYSQVSGSLPISDIPVFQMKKGFSQEIMRFGFARCQLDITTGGKLAIRFPNALGITLWVDGIPTETHANTSLDLKTGRHTLTLAIDFMKRKEGLTVILDDAPGSAARARFVTGK